jgi:hypothetical protein
MRWRIVDAPALCYASILTDACCSLRLDRCAGGIVGRLGCPLLPEFLVEIARFGIFSLSQFLMEIAPGARHE